MGRGQDTRKACISFPFPQRLKKPLKNLKKKHQEMPFQPPTGGCSFALETTSTHWHWPRPSSAQMWIWLCWAQCNTTNESCHLSLKQRRRQQRFPRVYREHDPTERQFPNLQGAEETCQLPSLRCSPGVCTRSYIHQGRLWRYWPKLSLEIHSSLSAQAS